MTEPTATAAQPRPRRLAGGPGWAALVLLTSLLVSSEAYAYLDPGTGSLVIQVVTGSVLAVAYTVKVYWRNIRRFFRRGQD
ncbi:MAG TPA: hypothetical protein VJV23_03500 [Candidatus Polarisedimenticolia bacterium]|nr:hypothetical protein [Candidatus Polarisedimenticolia bacterium]